MRLRTSLPAQALGGALLCLLAAGCGSTAQPAPAPAGGGAPTAENATAQPKVNRLVMAVETPLIESNENRHLSPPYSWVLRPMYEHLIGIDPTNGRMAPQLATEWKVEPDGSSFRFKLRGDVQFHGGFGQFTAADVVEPWKQVIRDDSLAGSASFWRQVIKDIQVVGNKALAALIGCVKVLAFQWFAVFARFDAPRNRGRQAHCFDRAIDRITLGDATEIDQAGTQPSNRAVRV